MKEKRYLNWFNKIGYGTGDIAGNMVYALLSSFVLIYLTDTVGLSSGIVGTLMAMYLWVPMIISIFITILLSRLDVERANKKLISRMESSMQDNLEAIETEI